MKLGIIGAMEIEVALIKEQMTIEKRLSRAGREFFEGTLGETQVVVVRCGVGKVNAALCVQILADLFGVTHILNTGVAGSLDKRIRIGDFVVSTEACYHDVDACCFGYAPGEIPQLGTVVFPADPQLRELAISAVREAAPNVQVFEGRIVSGDQFISEYTKKEAIATSFQGLCVEMEGASIAQAAYVNGLPYVILRAISDQADEESMITYDVFEKQAAEHCAEIAARVAGMLTSSPAQ